MSRTNKIDNIPVHQSAGMLTSLAAERNHPAQQIVAKFTPVLLPVYHVLSPAEHLNTVPIRGILLAKAYSVFYPLEGIALEPLELAAGLASMLTNLLNPSHVFRNGELAGVFAKAGCVIRRQIIETEEEAQAFLRDPRVQYFFGLFDEGSTQLYLHKREQQILAIGILLLTMGKDVNPDNYDGWIANRLKTFTGALGILLENCCWTAAQCPPQESLTMCYRILSASFHLRRELFLICVSGARDSSRYGAVLREVLVFLQGVEMGHIILIDRYIFSKYPELLRIRSLRDSMIAMNKAWEYLASLPAGERFFAKILYDKNATAALNRQNFHLLANAAVAAAQFDTPSMRFYKGGNVTSTSGALADVVNRYLSLRMNLSHISLSWSDYSYMTDLERKTFNEAAEEARQGSTLLSLPEVDRSKEDGTIPAPKRAVAQ